LSPPQSPRPRSQGRKPARPAEFRQNKALTIRTDLHFERTSYARVARDYFSPFAPRQ